MPKFNPMLIAIAASIERQSCFPDLLKPDRWVEGLPVWELDIGRSGSTNKEPALLLETGMGAINAACGIHSGIRVLKPSALIQVGLSGAHLVPLKVGELVLGTEVVDHSHYDGLSDGSLVPREHRVKRMEWNAQFNEWVFEGEEGVRAFPADPELLEWARTRLQESGLPFIEGTLGGADQFNRHPDTLERIQQTFSTCCEDMESASGAQLARRFGIPHLSIRVISNNERSPDQRTHPGDPMFAAAFEHLRHLGAALFA